MKKLSVGLLASLLIISSTTVSAKTNNKHQNVKTAAKGQALNFACTYELNVRLLVEPGYNTICIQCR